MVYLCVDSHTLSVLRPVAAWVTLIASRRQQDEKYTHLQTVDRTFVSQTPLRRSCCVIRGGLTVRH